MAYKRLVYISDMSEHCVTMEAHCGTCGHKRRFRAWELREFGAGQNDVISVVAKRLRCGKCGDWRVGYTLYLPE